MDYDCVIIFHKLTNLTPYIKAQREVSPAMAKRYAEQRFVRLILLVRYAYNPETREHKVFCKIKCPINPFPVKGEFEAPSLNAVKYSLINLGWVETEAIAGFMLK